jgi:peptide/nickel transport system substrate-binding protein
MDNYVAPGDYDIVFYAFNLGLDPDSLFGLFHSSAMNIVDGVAKGFNRARYQNPRVDTLLEEGRRETDPAKRKQIYAEAQSLIADDVPFIPMYSNLYTDFYNGERILGGVTNIPGLGIQYKYRMWMVEE